MQDAPHSLLATSPLLPQACGVYACAKHRDVEEDAQITEVTCYQRSALKTLFFAVLALLSGGIALLLTRWFLRLQINLRLRQCKAELATVALVRTQYSEDLCEVRSVHSPALGALRTFEHRHLHYYWADREFKPLLFDTDIECVQYHRKYGHGYMTPDEVTETRSLYGKCRIDVPLKSVGRLLIDEVLHPFFVFQGISVAIWCWEVYYYYASAIFLISLVSASVSLLETRRNLKRIREMAGTTTRIAVFRCGERSEIDSEGLVPGDLVEVPAGGVVPCDLALLTGSAVMKESMLTGESVPVVKEPVPETSATYSIDHDKKHSLYQGTEVLQTRSYCDLPVLAVVTRTGFHTLKGKLIRSILYPKPNKFRFYQDSLKFVAVLASLSIVGFGVSLPFQLAVGVNTEDMVQRFLDLVTVTVPPALPAAMTVGTAIAIRRLRKKQIYCISPPRVNVSGNVTMMCFDKTGTLTEDSMALRAVIPAQDGQFLPTLESAANLPRGRLLENLAACQALKRINGEVMGDVMESVVLESTGWHLLDTHSQARDAPVTAVVTPRDPDPKDLSAHPEDVAILHTFHFSSNSKRMSVVTRSLRDDSFYFHLKGAPEVVSALCDPATVPGDFAKVYSHLSQTGYRIIACAGKSLPSVKFHHLKNKSADDFERDLTFLGLIVLQNALKPETLSAITELHRAGILTVMATGDAVLTGISVARECGIIGKLQDVYLGEVKNSEDLQWTLFPFSKGEEALNLSHIAPPWEVQQSQRFCLALSGAAFRYITHHCDDALVIAVLESAKVYGRMSPEGKSALVEQLQARGKLVGMCGDGANDCGALKTADIGISLSQAEASIAAPFSSKIENISSVGTVLREGRCALSTSLQAFKFMALYSMIQFETVTLLYLIGSNLSDNQFLVIDLFTVLPLALFMSNTGPRRTLSVDKPTSALISVPVLTSVIGHTALTSLFQVLSWYFISKQSYYDKLSVKGETQAELNDADYCWENTALFLVSNFQYFAVCVVFSIGKPFKQEFYRNSLLTGSFLLLAALNFYIILFPTSTVRHFLGVSPTQIKPIGLEFKLIVLGLCVAYLLISYAFERCVIAWVSRRWQRLKSSS